MDLTLVTHPDVRLHDTGTHPEQPARIDAIRDRFVERGLWEETRVVEARPATGEEVQLVHTRTFYEIVENTRGRGPGQFDPDTLFSPDSARAALLAAGGAMTAAREVHQGATRRAFALVRPPGHHATPRRPMGFCLYNNVAIAARYLQAEFDIPRIAIVDFDVHHGNGTQEAFYDDPRVFYMSIHQYGGIFPGTGAREERGAGAGEGTTLNVPLRPHTPWRDYVAALEPALDAVFAWRPEFLLLSAGFDAHRADPLASLELHSGDFGTLTRAITSRAGRDLPIVSVLEGGYNLRALAESAEEHVRALMAD